MRPCWIVCGVDFSNASARALRQAAALARRSRACLLVLFVEDPLLAAAGRAAGDRRALPASAVAALDRFVKKSLSRLRRPRLQTALSVGDPAEEILKAAQHHDAGLVVLGTRGLGRTARLLLGSTADSVLRRARVPVLAVPS